MPAHGSLCFPAAFEPLEPRVHLDASTIFEFRSPEVVSQEIDLDGDGDLDLLARAGRSIGLALNDGTGTFGTPRYLGFNAQVHSVVVGDADGDSDLDLGVLTGSRLVRVYDLVSAVTNPAAPRRAITQLERAGLAFSFATFNGDDRPDVVVLDAVNVFPPTAEYRLRLYTQNAQGRLDAGQIGTVSTETSGDTLPAPYRLSVAQLIPASTKDEILLDTGYRTRAFFVTARSILQYEPDNGIVPRTPAEASAIGDFNGDGNLDYVSFSSYSEVAVVNTHLFTTISIMQRPPEPPRLIYTFAKFPTAAFLGQRIRAVGAADLTGDGLADLVIAFQTLDYNLRIVMLAANTSGGSGGGDSVGFDPEQLLAVVPVDEFFGSEGDDVRFVGFADTNNDSTLDPVLETTFRNQDGRSYRSDSRVFTVESATAAPWSPRDVFTTSGSVPFEAQFLLPVARSRIVSSFITGKGAQPAPTLVVDVRFGDFDTASRTVLVPLRA